jgi:hypothetical protein
MKSSLIIGVLSLILGGVLAYIQYRGDDPFLTFDLIIGILLGGGLGLLLGAVGGYSSKAQSLKKKPRTDKVEETPSDANSFEN